MWLIFHADFKNDFTPMFSISVFLTIRALITFLRDYVVGNSVNCLYLNSRKKSRENSMSDWTTYTIDYAIKMHLFGSCFNQDMEYQV